MRQSTQYLDAVCLIPRCGDATLAGTSSIQIDLDFVAAERDAGGTSVECDAHASAVGFAPGGDAEEAAEGGAGGHEEGG